MVGCNCMHPHLTPTAGTEYSGSLSIGNKFAPELVKADEDHDFQLVVYRCDECHEICAITNQLVKSRFSYNKNQIDDNCEAHQRLEEK